MIGLGVLGLVTGDFTPVWAPVPEGVPAREALAFACAIVSLGSGVALCWKRTAAPAARVLLAALLIVLLLRVSAIVRAPAAQDSWSGPGENAATGAAAW